MGGGSAFRQTQKREGLRPLGGRRFRFFCNKDLPCFTACCADLRLILTPYDIIRMKNRLQIRAEDLLRDLTVPDSAGEAVFPMVKLRMKEGGRRKCPFVTDQGCSIYEDRPGACRLYPLGRASFLAGSTKETREHHFVVEESHCLGLNEEREWTVEEWVKDQGADIYNEMNRPWMEIVTSQNPRKRLLSEQQIQMFYMVSYNIARFRDFVFRTKFLRVFELSPEEIDQVSAEETELMKLGMRWLRFALYGENTLSMTYKPAL